MSSNPYATTVQTGTSNTTYNSGYYPQQNPNAYPANTGTQSSLSDRLLTQMMPQSPNSANIQQYNPQGGSQESITKLNNSMSENYDYARQKKIDFDNSIVGAASPYIKAGTGLISGAASLASIYTGLQTLKLQKKADRRADEVLGMQKTELAHIKKVRDYNSKNWNDNTGTSNKVG